VCNLVRMTVKSETDDVVTTVWSIGILATRLNEIPEFPTGAYVAREFWSRGRDQTTSCALPLELGDGHFA
ncbi:MAG: hypothetical protein KDA96_06490, partial [Planctomycetaceae bacterium]|nr:hypothetical protein [Planctomycetaceae bacterium]